MAWDDSSNKGFTTGTPWMPVIAPPHGTTADQENNPDSILKLFHRLIAIKRQLPSEAVRFRDSPPQTVVMERGNHLIAVNLGDEPAAITRPGELMLEAAPGDGEDPASLAPHGAWVSEQ
jgi:alpha-glucosidase